MATISHNATVNTLGNPNIFRSGNVITLARNNGSVTITIVSNAPFNQVETFNPLNNPAISNLPVLGLTVNYINPTTITITGNPTQIAALASYTIDFLDALSAIVDSITFDLEIVSPTIASFTQDSCTYCANVILDNNDWIIANTPIASRGRIEYFYKDTDNNDVLVSGQSIPNITSVKQCFCEAGQYNFRTILTVREIPNCGGTSPIVFQAIDDYNNLYTVQEYVPEITIPAFDIDCCITVSENVINIIPSLIDFNGQDPHDSCSSGELKYVVTNPDGETDETSYSLSTPLGVVPSPENYYASFIPNIVGIWKVVITLQNCCATITKNYEFTVCNGIILTNPTCNVLNVFNSFSNSVEYSIASLSDNDTFVAIAGASGTIASQETLEYTFEQDGIYRIGFTLDTNLFPESVYSLYNGKYYYFLIDCATKNCWKTVLKDYLCGSGDCCDTKQQKELLEKRIKISSLVQILHSKYAEFKEIQNQGVVDRTLSQLYTNGDEIDEIVFLSELIKQIRSVCEECGVDMTCNDCFRAVKLNSSNTTSNTDCGCN